MDMIVFIYAFAWVFVLSSVIPSLILGKERNVFTQFIVVLTLTLTAFLLVDVLKGYGLDLANPTMILSNPYTALLANPFFAVFYLSLPYVFMLIIDINSRNKRKQTKLKTIINDYFANISLTSAHAQGCYSHVDQAAVRKRKTEKNSMKKSQQ